MLRDLDAGEDGVLTFYFTNLDDADELTVRFENATTANEYYRFRFTSGDVNLEYDNGAIRDTVSLSNATTQKNNNVLRLERCSGQILWREQNELVRLNAGSNNGVLAAVVEAEASATNVQISVTFEPNASLCNKCAVAGGTTLYPGDLMFVGYDNTISPLIINGNSFTNLSNGNRIAVRTQRAITPGTSFLISEAIYEVSDSTWTAGNVEASGYTPQAISSQRITYVGRDTIQAGEVICFELPTNSLGEQLAFGFHLEGSPSSDFCVTNVGNNTDAEINIANSGSNATALFLQQGDWKFTATNGIFCGRTLSGLQYGATWESSSGSDIPPDIACFEIQATASTGEEAATIDVADNLSYKNALIQISTNFSTNWTIDNTEDSDPLCDSPALAFTDPPTQNLSITKVYPNPFSETLWVEFDLATAQTVEASLVDLNGRTVYHSLNTNILSAGHHQLELAPNIPPQRTGLLLLRIITSNGVTVRRVIYSTPTDTGRPTTTPFGRG